MSTASGTRAVSPWRILAVLLIAAAIVCGVVAAATWQDVVVEGAYLNSSTGKAIFSGPSFGDYELARTLLGAAIGLGVAGLLVLAVSLSFARRQAPEAPARAVARGR